MTPEFKTRFEQEIKNNKIVIYMKGNALFPSCGFSAEVVERLKPFGPLHTVDVLTDPGVRDAIKEFTNWPTIPQVFIRGKFVGGCDIVRELANNGELEAMFQGA